MLLQNQRAVWRARVPDYAQRMDDPARLREAFKVRLEDFVRAGNDDVNCRPCAETHLADGMPVLNETDHVRRRLKRWMTPSRVAANAMFLPAHCEIVPKPLGVVGVISPWNYPVNLALVAGNHVLLKPSRHTPRTSALLAELLAEVFPPGRVAIVQDASDVAVAFSALPFGHLLFTGSTAVGAEVLAAAAPNPTQVTLELDGESPAIVAPGCVNVLNVARIAAGKFFNAGQPVSPPTTCWCTHASVKRLWRISATMSPRIIRRCVPVAIPPASSIRHSMRGCRRGWRRCARRMLDACTAGCAAVNDTVLQFVQSRLPVGGVGPSGMTPVMGVRDS